MRSITLGLDFGTTNTVVSLARDNGITTLQFKTQSGLLDTVRTVLAMWQDPAKSAPSVAVGRDALAEFAEFPSDTRLIQSLKSYAANPLFRQTMMLNRAYTFALLMREFLEQLFRQCDIKLSDVSKIIVGRPVRFAGYNPDEKLALTRYREAFAGMGIPHVAFVHEPVAAALTFARRLEKSATVLIGDFGGGTTDFSILRLAAPGDDQAHKVLGVGGIAIAGDQFDYRIVYHAVLPQLGLGTQFRSMGKILDLPKPAFSSLARWNELSFLRNSAAYEDLKGLFRHALQPELLQRFFHIVDHNRGLALYDAVSQVKRQLSTQDVATLHFEDLETRISREMFNTWIADDLARIAQALEATLAHAHCDHQSIDSVFLTGGSSLVPAVRQIFTQQFGAHKIHAGDELISVAKGLSQASAAEMQSA